MRPRLCLGAKVSRSSRCCIYFQEAALPQKLLEPKTRGKEIDAVNGDDADEEVNGVTERTEELQEVRRIFVAFVQSWPDSWAIPLTSSTVSGTFRFDILCAHVTLRIYSNIHTPLFGHNPSRLFL